jgi:hypothetical protein
MKLKLTNPFPRSGSLGVLGALIVATTAFGGTVPGNLGSGLDVLVRERQAQQASDQSRSKLDPSLAQLAQGYRDNAFINDKEQVKVYIHLNPATKKSGAPESVLPAAAELTAKDMTYRSGVLEAWVSLDDVVGLASDKRVKSVQLAIRPILDVGAVTSQGVMKHRVDQIMQDGTGITIGAMSDSYDAAAANAGVASGDLPGTANPNNTQPVVVLDDPLAVTGSDEGRAMLELIHDMAPKSRLGFATASTGQVSFADNIRSLAGIPGASHTVPGFRADVIVDDLFYADSPMFGTSLVGRAVNEVAALGISYFSSAGNRPAANGYFSDYRHVSSANLAAATAGTNLNFSGVDPALYTGGFHNFRTDGGQDIAQTVSQGQTTSASAMAFQWDDPYDVDPPSFNPTPFFQASGTATSTTEPTNFTLPNLVASQQYRVTVIANPPPPTNPFDAVVEIYDPNNTLLLRQDTGTDEEIFFFANISGNYRVAVYAFTAATGGTFDIKAYNASGVQRVTTDYNVLFFRVDNGAFISAFAAKNQLSNQPFEFGNMPFVSGAVQVVIARANTPTAPVPATKVRYVNTSVGQPVEYYDYHTPITYGHNHEPGCISAAAYSPFRPYIPEDFTSPGPSYIYFDQNANRLATPIIRQKPDVAAQDGANNTFFGSDAAGDIDAFPNFYGTSAAAPHAAAIAALVLQANGGSGSVTQPQMRTILQRSGYAHDLDPFFSTGSARTSNGGKITITARGQGGNFNYSDGRVVSTDDLRSFGVTYVGPGSVNTLSINVQSGNTTGGSELGPQPGLVWDSRARTTTAASGFPFTVGTVAGGIAAANITGMYSLPAAAPAVAGQFYQLDMTFAAGTFSGGRAFTFGADRDEQRTQNTTTATTGFGNSGDLLGATVAMPEGTVVPGGAVFSGTTSDGGTFSGVMVNRIGKGYSFLDGYGFINAQDAVTQPLP